MALRKSTRRIIALSALLLAIVIGIVAVIRYDERSEAALQENYVMDDATKAYNACVKAGGAVLMSYPPACQGADGRSYSPSVR